MKKKIIAILLIIILLGLLSYVSAQNITQNNKEKDTYKSGPQVEFIDYFDWGIITGTYEIKKYNVKGQLVLKNEDYSKTLRIISVGWSYDLGEIPFKTFGYV
jgi:hypothetical protein